MWGGVSHAYWRSPYMKVSRISLQGISKEVDETGVTTAGEQNALGSHLGYWDFQFNYQFNDESSSSKCTTLHLFEDGWRLQAFVLNDGNLMTGLWH